MILWYCSRFVRFFDFDFSFILYYLICTWHFFGRDWGRIRVCSDLLLWLCARLPCSCSYLGAWNRRVTQSAVQMTHSCRWLVYCNCYVDIVVGLLLLLWWCWRFIFGRAYIPVKRIRALAQIKLGVEENLCGFDALLTSARSSSSS